MNRIVARLAAALLLAVCATASQASVIFVTANLSGAAESPPTGSPGTGFATVRLDTLAHLLHVTAVFSGLTAGTTASHIHCCTAAPGTGNAGVATQTPSFVGFPLGVTSGTFDQTYDTSVAATWNGSFITASGGIAGAEAALFAALSSGEAYYNIHTSNLPRGEIRGFLVPEPGTLALLAIGAAAIGFGRRRATSR